jgi:hypothetical protein
VVRRAPGRRLLILLLVEGPSDQTTLSILAGKIVPSSVPVSAFPVNKGDLFNPQKLSIHIGYFFRKHPELHKVLACVDSEGIPIDETQGRVATLEKQLQTAFRHLRIKYIVVDHSLEGWLLCDRSAMRKILGEKAKMPSYGNPENLDRPADLMERIFRKNRSHGYIKTRDAPLLAKEIDPRNLIRLSDTFKDFRKYLLS